MLLPPWPLPSPDMVMDMAIPTTDMDTMVITMDTTLERGPLNLNPDMDTDMGTLMDTDMVTMDTITDTTLAKGLLMLNLRPSPKLKLNPLPPLSPDTVTDTVMVMDMVIPLLTDTTDTMLWEKDLLNPVMVIPTLMAMLTVMVTPTLMDTTDTIIWARDPLNLATVILMLMVMVIVTMVIMDTPMAMASKFILLT